MLEFAASSIAYDCVMSLLYLKKEQKMDTQIFKNLITT